MLQRCSSNSTSTFSLLFPAAMSPMEEPNYYYSSSSSSVDCTLSLGTPSTRNPGACTATAAASVQRSSFCWDIVTTQSKSQQQAAAVSSSSSNLGGSDPLLLARRCANCDTTSTPLWRNGPRGPKSLCNACGIRYKKEERRAAASTASPAASNFNDAAAYQRQQQQQQYHWMASPPSTRSAGWCQGDDADQGMDQTPSYLSWRLNVVPPPQSSLGLYQYQ